MDRQRAQVTVMTPAIFNRPLPDTITNTGRSYSFAPVSGYPFSWVLEIVQVEQKRPDRSETEVYGVEEVTDFATVPEGRREFAVAKCSAELGDDNEGIYFVSLPGPVWKGFAICWCRGFGRHQRCKHSDVLFDLLQRGEL